MRPAAVRQLLGLRESWRAALPAFPGSPEWDNVSAMILPRRRTVARGFGLIEVVLVLVVVAFAGFLLVRYLGSTARTVEKIQEERPIANARLLADQTTLAAVRDTVRTYQAQNGQWPSDKAAVLALFQSPPRFQCAGNDFEHDPTSGTVRLLITDSARCRRGAPRAFLPPAIAPDDGIM